MLYLAMALMGNSNMYNIAENPSYIESSYTRSNDFYTQDNWLPLFVANKVGKTNVKDLTLEDYKSIEILTLPDKGIKVLPDEVQYLTNLKKLNLSNNEITSISKNIKYMTALEELNLSGNKITTLPDELVLLSKNAPNLKKINLSNNLLLYKLENIDNLKSVVELDVSQNPIANVDSPKILMMNNIPNLQYKVGDSLSLATKEILKELRFYNLITKEIQILPTSLTLNVMIDKKEVLNGDKFSKEGQYYLDVSIKNASIINGKDNSAIIIRKIPVTITAKAESNTYEKVEKPVEVIYSEKIVKVIKDKTTILKSASASSDKLADIGYGKGIKVVGEEGNFYKVQYDQKEGYILKSDVEDAKYSLKEVSSTIASIYLSKDTNSEVYARVPKKQLVKVYYTSGEWSVVSYGNKIAYMKAIDLVDTVTYIGQIISAQAKVRETPSEKSNALGMMTKGDKVEIYENMNNGWYKIKYINKVGYLKASDVKISSEVKISDDTQNKNVNTNIVQNPSNIIKPDTNDLMKKDLFTVVISLIGIICINIRTVFKKK